VPRADQARRPSEGRRACAREERGQCWGVVGWGGREDSSGVHL